MKRISLLTSAILTSAFALGSSAAVICEFEPTEDYRDCAKCFKADSNGVQLFIKGELRASSTSHVLFPTAPIDGQVFQRGIEKVLISERHGHKKLYEVCYEKAAPTQASDFQLYINGAGLEEFEMVPPGAGPAENFQFAVTSSPAGVRVAFFGSKLVVKPLPGWDGSSELGYEFIDSVGQRSKPGRISLRLRGSEMHVQSADVDVAALEIASAERRLSELAAQLNEALKSLRFENDTRDGYRNAVKALEGQLQIAQARLDEVQFQIASAVRTKERARAKHLQDSQAQAFDFAAGGYRRFLLAVSMPEQQFSFAAVTESPETPPQRVPARVSNALAILPREMGVLRVLGNHASHGSGPWPKPLILAAPAKRIVSTRRLTKKAKKQLRKQRQRDPSTPMGVRSIS